MAESINLMNELAATSAGPLPEALLKRLHLHVFSVTDRQSLANGCHGFIFLEKHELRIPSPL